MLRFVLFTVAPLLIAAKLAFAEPVMVRGTETGQGYIFSHNGNCYAVFPAHVTNARARVQVIAEGAVSGVVTPRFPFWDGVDLAVGTVRRDAATRCTATLRSLAPSTTPPPPEGRGTLVLIGTEGQVVRHRMQLTEIGYLTLDAGFANAADASVMQGMSGAFLFVDGRPVGMALETTEDGGARFMRIEELHMNLSRWLGTQRAVTFDTRNRNTSEPVDSTGLELVMLSASVPALTPGDIPENMLIDSGAYVFAPVGQPSVEVRVGALSEKTAVQRVTLYSDPDAGHALPRRVVLQVNASAEGERWRTFWTGEMPRTGVLDTGKMSPTFAKRVRVVIGDAWSTGPLRIDRIKVE